MSALADLKSDLLKIVALAARDVSNPEAEALAKKTVHDALMALVETIEAVSGPLLGLGEALVLPWIEGKVEASVDACIDKVCAALQARFVTPPLAQLATPVHLEGEELTRFEAMSPTQKAEYVKSKQ